MDGIVCIFAVIWVVFFGRLCQCLINPSRKHIIINAPFQPHALFGIFLGGLRILAIHYPRICLHLQQSITACQSFHFINVLVSSQEASNTIVEDFMPDNPNRIPSVFDSVPENVYTSPGYHTGSPPHIICTSSDDSGAIFDQELGLMAKLRKRLVSYIKQLRGG